MGHMHGPLSYGTHDFIRWLCESPGPAPCPGCPALPLKWNYGSGITTLLHIYY